MSEDNAYYVVVEDIINYFKLEEIYIPPDGEKNKICSADVSRPGLPIAGFLEFFECDRIQIIGKAEISYLASLDKNIRKSRIESIFEKNIPVLILARNIDPMPEMLDAARKYSVPILKTHLSTSNFISYLIGHLNLQLAERTTEHGVLVEVYGEGVLILGESGVGKSETAIELVKRGHRLVADDVVEVKRASERTLIGSAPESIRHYIEIRGIGIIDVKKIFGMGSVKDTEKIDMVIHLENWKEHKQYERLGMDDQYTMILGLNIPSLTVPVKPGRNLAIITEVAAMNNRQKKMGYNAAQELSKRIKALKS